MHLLRLSSGRLLAMNSIPFILFQFLYGRLSDVWFRKVEFLSLGHVPGLASYLVGAGCGSVYGLSCIQWGREWGFGNEGSDDCE